MPFYPSSCAPIMACGWMQVRSSPVDSKRSFLEKKSLTPQEIAEAFKRVPDTPSASAPAAPSGVLCSVQTSPADAMTLQAQPPITPVAAIDRSLSLHPAAPESAREHLLACPCTFNQCMACWHHAWQGWRESEERHLRHVPP